LGPPRGYIARTQCRQKAHVEAGTNTSTVALQVVGGNEKGPSAWGYDWATLFLGDINTGRGPPGPISNLRQLNMVMSPAVIGPENECAGEDQ
jgi:hypothetical protein